MDFAERFWSKVLKTEGCWIWTASRYRSGYGMFAVARSTPRPAHRVAWSLINGDPGSMFVCHRCDNRICVRPSHLFLGTAKDNARDMASKGRQVFQRKPERAARGHRNHNAKLTESNVVEILKLLAGRAKTHAAIAAEFGVKRSTVGEIARGRAWRHVAWRKGSREPGRIYPPLEWR